LQSHHAAGLSTVFVANERLRLPTHIKLQAPVNQGFLQHLAGHGVEEPAQDGGRLGAEQALVTGHGVEAALGGYVILNSYHCSRLNTNTGRLTPAMFEAIFRRAREIIES
jgi:hypothetical protein